MPDPELPGWLAKLITSSLQKPARPPAFRGTRFAPADATATGHSAPATLGGYAHAARQAIAGIAQGATHLPADAAEMLAGLVSDGPAIEGNAKTGTIRYTTAPTLGQTVHPALKKVASTLSGASNAVGDVVGGGAPADVSDQSFRQIGSALGNLGAWETSARLLPGLLRGARKAVEPETATPNAISLDGKTHNQYAILTAENAGGKAGDATANAAANAKLEAALRAKGFDFHPVLGAYTDNATGELLHENSYLVPRIAPAEAEALARQFGQNGIVTHKGYHDLADNKLYPSSAVVDATDAPFTQLPDGRKVRAEINWDAGEPLAAPRAAEAQPVLADSVVARAASAHQPPLGFGLGATPPAQEQLTYFRGPRTSPRDLNAAYGISRRAFDHNGPYAKFLDAGRKYESAEPWYASTQDIYKDAADAVGPEAATQRVNDLLGKFMPSVTARSAPPSNLQRAFLWQQLVDRGEVTPELLKSHKIIPAPGFGHFAQNAHQSTLARTLEGGAVDPIANPKPAAFGANLTGNMAPGTFDTVMGRILRDLNKRSAGRFFKAAADDATAPVMWAYQPFERGLADAAEEAAKAGVIEPKPGLSPTAAYQSLGWHGATGSAEYGSMADIWRRMRKQSADLWGVSEGKANDMIWRDGAVPLLPQDVPLMRGTVPFKRK